MRRHLILTLSLTLDDELCDAVDRPSADGFSAYQDMIDALRTAVHHQAGALLAPLDPQLDVPTVTYDGVTSAISTDLETAEIPAVE